MSESRCALHAEAGPLKLPGRVHLVAAKDTVALRPGPGGPGLIAGELCVQRLPEVGRQWPRQVDKTRTRTACLASESVSLPLPLSERPVLERQRAPTREGPLAVRRRGEARAGDWVFKVGGRRPSSRRGQRATAL